MQRNKQKAQEEPFINADKVMRDGVLLPLQWPDEEMFNSCMQPLMNLLKNLKK